MLNPAFLVSDWSYSLKVCSFDGTRSWVWTKFNIKAGL